MAVHSRISYLSQQRLDLQHLVGEQSFTAADFRLFSYILSGLDQNYIVRGLEIISATPGLKIVIDRANAIVITPTSTATSFYVSSADELPYEMTVPSNSTIFVEAYFERVTNAPVATAQWDPGAVTDQNEAGTEFTSSVDFQEIVDLKFRYNTSGFTSNGIKVAKVITGPSSVLNIVDSRDRFYRLATGGATPDYAYRYNWSTTRGEANILGDASKLGELSVDNPYFYVDGVGSRNDKALMSLKGWMDAVMTALLEIKGTPYWYSIGESFLPQILYFDGLNGSAVVPRGNYDFDWDNTPAAERIFASGTDGPMAWASSYGNFKWYLGGVYSTDLTGYLAWVTETRAYANKNFSLDLSGAPSSCVVFLKLDRETIPGATNDQEVVWGTGGDIGIYPEAQCVHGVAQDFSGIAVGDYVRRITDGYMSYHKVIGLTTDNSNVELHEGAVATAAVIGLVLEDTLTNSSIEKYKWYRANYESKDLYYTSPSDPTKVENEDAVLISASNTNLILIGRREGLHFYWRDLSQYLHIGRVDNDTYIRHTFSVRETMQVGPEDVPEASVEEVNRIRGGLYISGNSATKAIIEYENLFGDTALVTSGAGSSATDKSLTYFHISIPGTDADFGYIGGSTFTGSTASGNGVRAVFAGDDTTHTTDIRYVSFSMKSNASSFGTLTVGRTRMASLASEGRTVFLGGIDITPTRRNTIDYISLFNSSTAVAFGSLTAAKSDMAGVSNGIWGVVSGGTTNGTTSLTAMEYVTVVYPSNSASFASLSSARMSHAGVTNGARGLFAGGISGLSYLTGIEYFTIATKANSVSFGALTTGRSGLAAVSDGSRAVFLGGTTGSHSNVMDYVNISTAGAAVSFGTLSVARSLISATSGD